MDNLGQLAGNWRHKKTPGIVREEIIAYRAILKRRQGITETRGQQGTAHPNMGDPPPSGISHKQTPVLRTYSHMLTSSSEHFYLFRLSLEDCFLQSADPLCSNPSRPRAAISRVSPEWKQSMPNSLSFRQSLTSPSSEKIVSELF